MRKVIIVLLLLIGLTVGASAQPADYVHVRIVDCGQGLCCLIEMPGDKYMIYDAGSMGGQGTSSILQEVDDFFNGITKIDLLVLSHDHTDHTNAVEKIFAKDKLYVFESILRTGNTFEYGKYSNKPDWWKANVNSVGYRNFRDLNLMYHNCVEFDDYGVADHENCESWHGFDKFNFGEVSLTVICGWDENPGYFKKKNTNTTSIVLRLDYADRSILFTGDAEGFEYDDDITDPISSEEYMLAHRNDRRIDSDILIVPHHGSDSSSSTEFIGEVSPEYVIISAGHYGIFDHPRAASAARYVDFLRTVGLDERNIFRTDLGDDEGDLEWDYGRIYSGDPDNPTKDPIGDDNIDIRIYSNGSIEVKWEDPH